MKTAILVVAALASGCSVDKRDRDLGEYLDCVHHAVFAPGLRDAERNYIADGCRALYEIKERR